MAILIEASAPRSAALVECGVVVAVGVELGPRACASATASLPLVLVLDAGELPERGVREVWVVDHAEVLLGGRVHGACELRQPVVRGPDGVKAGPGARLALSGPFGDPRAELLADQDLKVPEHQYFCQLGGDRR